MARMHRQSTIHTAVNAMLWVIIGVYFILLLLGSFRRWPSVELIVQLAVGLTIFTNLLVVSWQRWPGPAAALLAGGIALTLTLGIFWLDVLPAAGRGLVIVGFLLAGLTIWHASGERQLPAATLASAQSLRCQRRTIYLVGLSLAIQVLGRSLLTSTAATAAPSVTFGLLGVLCYCGLRAYHT